MSRRTRAATHRPRLRIETLEVRDVPATVTWDGGAGTFAWGDAANWSGDVLPATGDDVEIDIAGSPTVTLTSRTVTIKSLSTTEHLVVTNSTLNLAESSEINGGFTFNSGTMTGAGNLTVSDNFAWAAGTMSGTGALVLAPGSISALTGSEMKYLDRALDNWGAVTYTGSSKFSLGASAAWLTRPGGSFTMLGGADLFFGTAQEAVFANHGTLISTGPGVSEFSARLDSTGTINVQAGTLQLKRPSDLAAGAAIGAGAIEVGGSYTTTLGGTFAAARVVVSNGTLAVPAGAPTIGDLTITGGTVTGAGDLAVTGTLAWTEGTVSGAGTLVLPADSTATLSGGGYKYLDRAVDNRGVVSYSGSRFSLEPSAAWLTRPGGSFTLLGGADLFFGSSPDAVFANHGTLISTGPGVSEFSARLDSTGTIDVQAGTLQLKRPSDLAAGAAIGAGAIEVGGSYTTTLGGTFAAARVVVSNGTLAVPAGAPTIGDLTLDLGSLTGAGDLTVTGAFTWAQATLAGAGTLVLAPGSTTTLSGGEFKTLGRPVNNWGTATYTGSRFVFGASASEPGAWVTHPGGSFALLNGADVGYAASTDGVFTNHGALVKEGPQESTFTGVRLDSTGTIDVRAGTLKVANIGSPAGTLSFDGVQSLRTAIGTDFIARGPVGGSTTNADQFDARGRLTLAGPGTAGAPQLFEVMSQDRGAGPAGGDRNFHHVALHLDNTYARLVDQHDNAAGGNGEALYVDSLVVPAGSTLDLNGFKVYARHAAVGGTVTGGSVTPLADGGVLLTDTPTLGRVAAAGEFDEWTVFVRRGESYLFRLDPGNGSAVTPPAPVLGHGGIDILDPVGNLVATADGITSGQVLSATLANANIEGTYRVRVRAATSQSTSTGHYQVAAFRTTIDTRAITFSQAYTGTLESNYSIDRWTFAANANQQVRLDRISASDAGITFRLSGPAGWVAFSGQAVDSDPVTLPSDGQYTLEVTGPKGAYAFRVDESAVTALALGVPYSGSLAGDGAARLFQFNNPTASPLRVRLDGNRAEDRLEVYLRHSAPPTRRDFSAHGVEAAATQTIDVPLAPTGTWYVLVYGTSVAAGNSYTLTATTAPVLLRTVTPDRYGAGQPATLTLEGAGFVPNTQVELVGGAVTRAATTVTADGFDRISAAFDLASVPAGAYDVRVRRPDAATAVLAGAFQVLPAGVPKLETRLVLPASLGRRAAATLYVEYENSGKAAMPAPILTLQSADADGSDHPLLSLDPTRFAQGFWTSAKPDSLANSVQIYAGGARPGLLLPGEKVRVPVYYAGLQPPWDSTDDRVELEIRIHDAGNSDAIDWAALKPTLKPPAMAADAWDAVFANLTAQIGPTWGDYVRRLGEVATYLDRLGRKVGDVSQLFSYEARLANGLPVLEEVAGAVDAVATGPGLPAVFGRAYGNTVTERYQVGPFGRGWATAWDVRAVALADGTVILHESADRQRRFQPDSRKLGAYFSAPGDTSTLHKLAGGNYELTAADGTVTQVHPDGRLDYVEDVNANRVTAAYAGGRLSALTHSAGTSVGIAYNAGGRIASLTESTGRVTTFGYDAAGEHLLTATGPAGTTTYTYSLGNGPAREHALTSVTDPGGVTTTFEYDAFGRLSAIELPGGAERTTFATDVNGRTVVTDAAGVATLLSPDNRGLLARVEDAAGNFVRYVYDVGGRPILETDSAGRAQSYAWCGCGSLRRITDPLGATTTFIPGGPFNQPQAFVDARGTATEYTYGVAGNPVATTYADGSVERASYDGTGLPTQLTNRRGQAVALGYTPSGRVAQETYPDGSTVTYTYDARDRLETATDATGTTQFGYDAADRVNRIDSPNGRWIVYTFDAAGRRTRMEDHTGFVTNYTFDAAGRLATLKDTANATLVTYVYDDAGRLIREDKGNGTSTAYDYDPLGRLEAIEHRAPGGGVNARFEYTYDGLGRRTGAITPDGTWAYQYDLAGQLVQASFDSTNPGIADQDLAYEYDALGNRTRTVANGAVTDYTANALNQYTAAGSTSFIYDRDGNLVQESSAAGTRRYTYDTLNRLTKVETPAGVTEYEYDLFGHRTATVVDGVRTEYLVDPFGLGEVVGEYDAAGMRQASYARGLGLEGVSGAGVWCYYDFDAIGSTAGVSGPGGAYLNQYAYDPFGGTMARTEVMANPFEYVGQAGVTTEASGLQFMRARFYDVAAGRFTSQDPIRLRGGINLYTYSTSDPVNLTDPSGLSPDNEDWEDFFRNQGQRIGTVGGFAGGTALGGAGGGAATGGNPAGVLWGGRAGGMGGSAAGFYAGGGVGGFFGRIIDFIDNRIRNGPERVPYDPNLPCGGYYPCGDFPGLNPPPLLPPNPPGQDGDSGGAGVANSIDPNEKFGAAGFGSSAFIAIGEAIPYQVHFENLGLGSVHAPAAPATAPAQRVEITDQLSADLDWDTLEFTGFGFGDVVWPLSGPAKYQAVRVPMAYNGTAFEVDTELTLDPATGLVRVVFQSVDPDTTLPPDVLTGFLPPEDGTGRGKGYVSYSVRPKSGLATGTEIRNIAVISFDGQTIIATNQVDPHDPAAGTDPAKEARNTIDAVAPTSNVSALPTEMFSVSFPLRWSGADDANGSGIAFYDVYVSDNGGPFTPLAERATETSALFRGAPGHEYRFYSVATDAVGQQQATFAEVTTRISAADGAKQTFVDEDGDAYTVSLAGPGQLSFLPDDPDGNGKGPVGILLVQGTDPARSKLVVRVKKAGAGDGLVSVAAIEGTGLKAITTAASDVVRPGIRLSGPLGGLSVRDIRAGAVVEAGGTAAGKTTVRAHQVFDGVSIDLGTTVTSFTVAAVGDAAIRASSFGTLTVRGDPRNLVNGVRTPIRGDFAANLTLTGTSDLKKPISLSAATVSGDLTNSSWRISGGAGTVKAGGTVTGWDLVVSGGLKQLTLGAVADATVDVDGAIGSVRAARWEAGHLTAGTIGTLAVTGNFGADLTVTMAGKLGIDRATVGGAVAGSTIRVAGTVNAFTAGAFVNSALLVGFAPANPLDPFAGGTFTAGIGVRSLTVTGVKGSADPAFSNSLAAATRFGTVRLKSVGGANGGTPFGLLTDEGVRRLTVGDPALNLTDVTADPVLPPALGDFAIRVV